VRGVCDVATTWTVHARTAGVPSLQGSSSRPGRWSTWLTTGWSPTALLIAGASGAAILAASIAARRA
jgi:hypothetical protein